MEYVLYIHTQAAGPFSGHDGTGIHRHQGFPLARACAIRRARIHSKQDNSNNITEYSGERFLTVTLSVLSISILLSLSIHLSTVRSSRHCDLRSLSDARMTRGWMVAQTAARRTQHSLLE